MMKRVLALLALTAGLFPIAALAQSAVVVSACGTPPSTYSAGQSRQTTQDTTGALCGAASPAQPVTPPTLTKGTQGSTGFSVQSLVDSGRTTIALTSEFSFAQTAETLLTMTVSASGAATTTFTSRTITSGKRFRITHVSFDCEILGSGTAPQRAYLRLRVNTAGATTTSSPLQGVWGCVDSTAVVKSGASANYDIPDGIEFAGDGTATFGLTLETPDWVTSTATGRAKITVIGFEY